ncbi:DNA-binding protein [Listeria booriae]|uniref:DNA-binding protein n=1 Tax=Listeria booriae TaxID=1552123 RepID=UPI001623B1BA|nr:DNA-binding protein [Listeria booriae]MBC1522647.1 DNA-binding protein [Listeria booriae]MBC2256979.1 DNA-binding protein [Listeria booriae]
MFELNDDIIKQKIVADLNEYVMSQKQVADFLNMEPTTVAKIVRERKIDALYVFNPDSYRKVQLFYRKDVEEYKEKLMAYRALRIKK